MTRNKWIQHTLRGCGHLPHCGPHPGNAVLAVMILAGGLVAGSVTAALVAAAVFGPIYLVGAHGRSVTDMKIQRSCSKKPHPKMGFESGQ